MSKDILDDLDWENEHPEESEEKLSSHHEEEVVMLKTFNTEEQAHICAASLKNEGIDAHVISSVAGQLTPFAYGMVRLYVAESQAEEAAAFIKKTDAEQAVYENPPMSSTRILMIVMVGIFAIALIIGLVQYFL
jgi:ABC-type methionine transport system ATPase subunit